MYFSSINANLPSVSCQLKHLLIFPTSVSVLLKQTVKHGQLQDLLRSCTLKKPLGVDDWFKHH